MLKFREEMTRSPLDKQDGLDVHASELEIKKKPQNWRGNVFVCLSVCIKRLQSLNLNKNEADLLSYYPYYRYPTFISFSHPYLSKYSFNCALQFTFGDIRNGFEWVFEHFY